MSELNKDLQISVISLTEAEKFIGDMGDLLGNYADEVEMELFKKHETLSTQGKEPALSDFEESHAVFAYVNLLPDGLLMMLYSLFDECLYSVILEVSGLQGKQLNNDQRETGRFTAAQSIRFLTDEVGIAVVDLCPSWEKIESIRKLNDIVIVDHHYIRNEHISYLRSLAQGSKHFSFKDVYQGKVFSFDFDFDYLSELCKTMILFFQELEKPLSTLPDQQS